MADSTRKAPAQFRAPKDAPEGTSKGWAVYNRTLGQYVGPVTTDKPTTEAAQALAPRHTVAIVAV
jgi:hypothetical protein